MACRTNSLARLFPEIAALWHPTENGALTPNDLLPGSAQEVAWLCPRGHTFHKAVTFMRTLRQPCEDCRALDAAAPPRMPEWDDVGLMDPDDDVF
jgi:hypothetical protein